MHVCSMKPALCCSVHLQIDCSKCDKLVKLQLDGCNQLQDLCTNGCTSLPSLDIPGSSLQKLQCKDCAGVDKIELSRFSQLTTLILR